MPLRNALLLVLLPALSFGQLSSGSVTVSVSRGANLQPDQAVFSITVTSSMDKSLDDVIAPLFGLGITASNLVGVNSGSFTPGPTLSPVGPSPQPSLQWTFQLTVPLARIKDVTASLASLQKSIGQQNSGLSLSFGVQSTQVSAQSAGCDLAGLIVDARTQAQSIAVGAGLSAGAITGITTTTSTAAPAPCYLAARFALSGVTVPQMETSAITITASRPSTSQPDQVLIGLTLSSPVTSGLSDVTAAISGAGIMGANFTGVYTQTIYVTSGTQTQPQSSLAWSFTMTTPLTKLKDTLAQLVAAQQTVPKQNAGLSLAFLVEGTQVSQSTRQACSENDLVSDARAQAQKVAVTAGLTLGPAIGLAEGTAVAGAVVALPAARLGISNPVVSTPPQTCSLTVQFRIGG